MIRYSVKQLALLSGVSIRTLHHYDKIGLLKPSVRTEARYRMYGETELLRLQQILFYKELDFSLERIMTMLDDADFDIITALQKHRSILEEKANRVTQLLSTIDKTILKLKGEIMLNDEELYAGLSKETTASYRNQINAAYGADALLQAEKSLKQMSKADFEKLKTDFSDLYIALAAHRQSNVESSDVQKLIARHYEMIRIFWGTNGTPDPQWQAYKGLGELYVQEPSYARINGKPDKSFARFLHAAMVIFADTHMQLK